MCRVLSYVNPLETGLFPFLENGDVVGPTTTLGFFSSEDDWSKEEVSDLQLFLYIFYILL